MTRTQFVEYRDQGFWAYDVYLGIFLKHLIDVAELNAPRFDDSTLSVAIQGWRLIAVISDYGFWIDESLPGTDVADFLHLVEEACELLKRRDTINADEVVSWPILDDLRIFPRGATEFSTQPIIELGRAMIALVDGKLPVPPVGIAWFYGPSGRTTIGMSR